MPLDSLSYNELARITAALVEILGGSVSFQHEEIEKILRNQGKTVLIRKSGTSVSLVLSDEKVSTPSRQNGSVGRNYPYFNHEFTDTSNTNSELSPGCERESTASVTPELASSSSSIEHEFGSGKPDLETALTSPNIKTIKSTLLDGEPIKVTIETTSGTIYSYIEEECLSARDAIKKDPFIYPYMVIGSTGRFVTKVGDYRRMRERVENLTFDNDKMGKTGGIVSRQSVTPNFHIGSD